MILCMQSAYNSLYNKSFDTSTCNSSSSPNLTFAGQPNQGGILLNSYLPILDKDARQEGPAAEVRGDNFTVTATTELCANNYDVKSKERIVADIRGDGQTQNCTTEIANGIQKNGRFPDSLALVGLLSLLSFDWVDKIVHLGKNRTIQLHDLWNLREPDEMKYVGDCFETKHRELRNCLEERALHDVGDEPDGGDVKVESEEEEDSSPTSIPRFDVPWSFFKVFGDPVVLTLAALYGRPFFVAGLVRLLTTIVGFFPPLILKSLLGSLESGELRTAHRLCLILFAFITTKTFLINQYFYKVTCLGSKVGGALSTAVYRKSLRLSPSARQSVTVGEITNYVQLDAQHVERLISHLHPLWDSALQIIGCSFFLHRLLGPSAFIGIAIMTCLIPLNAMAFQKLAKCRMEILGCSDARVRVMNEMLQGIRAIKFYNWEEAFKQRVNNLHENELRILQNTNLLRSFVTAVISTVPPIVIGLSLATYAYLGNILDPSTVFTTIALFGQLRLPLYFLPVTLSSLLESIPSIDRLSAFLVAEELIPYVQRQNDAPHHYADDVAVSIESGVFTWTQAHPLHPASQKVKESSEGESGGSSARTLMMSTPAHTPSLHGIQLEVKTGELVAIVGEVGTGKSSLLSALLGEIRHVAGRVYVNGSITYVPQIPWIPNDTVKGNVIFGSDYNKDRYREALSAACLDHDLELLEFGDMTEIGEQGVNLSGGQKQRLSIARALYKGADVYLLDDPLSALDPQVGQEVFDRCICGTMARDGATRVLVTNQLQYLPFVDHVIVMGKLKGVKGGTIIDQGTYEELQTRSHNLLGAVNSEPVQAVVEKATSEADILSELAVTHSYIQGVEKSSETTSYGPGSPVESITEPDAFAIEVPRSSTSPSDIHPSSSSEEGTVELELEEQESATCTTPMLPLCSAPTITDRSSIEVVGIKTTPLSSKTKVLEASGTGTKGILMSKEDRATGAVPLSAYVSYLRAAGKPLQLLAVCTPFLVGSLAVQLQQWVISYWVRDFNYVSPHTQLLYLSSLVGLTILVSISTQLSTFFAWLLGIKAARKMHRKMLHRVLNAPVLYFDTNPIGRIVQRFSKDTNAIGQELPSLICLALDSFMDMITCLLSISFAVPAFTILLAPLSYFYMRIANYARPASRELQRLISITRSPIYAHFGESLGGLSAIRVFGQSQRFISTNEDLLNKHIAAAQSKKAVDRWLSIRFELLGSIVVLVAGLFSVRAANRGSVSASLSAISLTNALMVTGLFNWVFRCCMDVESHMTGVERVLHTSTETPQEALQRVYAPKRERSSDVPECTDDAVLQQTSWPWEGAIEFRGVNMRYRPDTILALKGVDLAIKPGEKVGVVGRTGSGKTSLLRALFRMVEPEAGTVLLDGVDCSRVGISTLRSSLTIIPQDPVLFSGTLRSNLDPYGSFSDEEVVDALKSAKLNPQIYSQSGLMSKVLEHGLNFSPGQRQLICLARALLKKKRTRVLVLDEATSSIDIGTDELIQSVIAQSFQNTTVITIAHRQNTISNSDRVLVMDNGRVGEFGSPHELLKNPKSLYSLLLSAERNQLQKASYVKLQTAQ